MASFTAYCWVMEYAAGLLIIKTAVAASVLRWVLRPPAPRICGTPGGPPVTGSTTRVRLRDGRYLAYLETGVPLAAAAHKVVFVHGFDSCRHDVDVLPVSQQLLQDLGVCLVSYDRPGYGESDPNPDQTERSNAMDVQDLADQLGLGDRFHVVGFSMGGLVVWSCLRHIPHRIAGAALVAPVANPWWRGYPAEVRRRAWAAQLPRDRWAVSVAHHAPWLTYWWNTRKWFPPAFSLIAHDRRVFSPPDLKLISQLAAAGPRRRPHKALVKQQGVFETVDANLETLHRDMIVAFGNWSYSPLELSNPVPGKDKDGQGTPVHVHLWHGAEDRVVAPDMSRHIARELPWIRYHEVPDAGHLLTLADGMADRIVKSLLLP